MQTRPRTGHLASADQDLGPVAGVARHPVAVPHRDQSHAGRPVGVPGVAVGDAVAGRDVLGQRQPRPRRHRRQQSEVGGVPGRRVEAVRRDAAADQVEPGARPQDRGGGVGQVAHLRPQPGRLGDGECVTEGAFLRVVRGVVGLVAAGEVGPDAGDGPVPALLTGAGLADHGRPVGGGGAAAGEAGVDLELEPGRAAGVADPGGDLLELGDGVGGDVDVGGDRGRVVLPRHAEPAEHPPGVTAPAQDERLVDGGHAEPGGAALAGRPARGQDAVAVAVGLHDRHHVDTRCALAARARCGGWPAARRRSPRGPGSFP